LEQPKPLVGIVLTLISQDYGLQGFNVYFKESLLDFGHVFSLICDEKTHQRADEISAVSNTTLIKRFHIGSL
jgi:hypothetical protein